MVLKKTRRLAEASVAILKLAPKHPKIGSIKVEDIIQQLYPDYTEQRKGSEKSVSFITSSTKSKLNEMELRKRQLKLLEVTLSMALGFLQSGRHSLSLLAAQQYLVLAADLYGVNDLNLIPAYCLLAEICIGLNKLRESEQYLQKANWVVKRNEQSENINLVNSRLYRSFGLVQAAKGNNEEALRLFGEQVYYSSLVNGTESIGAANGYYNLANVWSREPGKKPEALSLYKKSVECWLEIISQENLCLSEAESGETMNMLNTTVEVIENSEKDSLDALRARALLLAYLKKVNLSNSDEEKSKLEEIIKSKQITDSKVQMLLAM